MQSYLFFWWLVSVLVPLPAFAQGTVNFGELAWISVLSTSADPSAEESQLPTASEMQNWHLAQRAEELAAKIAQVKQMCAPGVEPSDALDRSTLWVLESPTLIGAQPEIPKVAEFDAALLLLAEGTRQTCPIARANHWAWPQAIGTWRATRPALGLDGLVDLRVPLSLAQPEATDSDLLGLLDATLALKASATAALDFIQLNEDLGNTLTWAERACGRELSTELIDSCVLAPDGPGRLDATAPDVFRHDAAFRATAVHDAVSLIKQLRQQFEQGQDFWYLGQALDLRANACQRFWLEIEELPQETTGTAVSYLRLLSQIPTDSLSMQSICPLRASDGIQISDLEALRSAELEQLGEYAKWMPVWGLTQVVKQHRLDEQTPFYRAPPVQVYDQLIELTGEYAAWSTLKRVQGLPWSAAAQLEPAISGELVVLALEALRQDYVNKAITTEAYQRIRVALLDGLVALERDDVDNWRALSESPLDVVLQVPLRQRKGRYLLDAHANPDPAHTFYAEFLVPANVHEFEALLQAHEAMNASCSAAPGSEPEQDAGFPRRLCTGIEPTGLAALGSAQLYSTSLSRGYLAEAADEWSKLELSDELRQERAKAALWTPPARLPIPRPSCEASDPEQAVWRLLSLDRVSQAFAYDVAVKGLSAESDPVLQKLRSCSGILARMVIGQDLGALVDPRVQLGSTPQGHQGKWWTQASLGTVRHVNSKVSTPSVQRMLTVANDLLWRTGAGSSHRLPTSAQWLAPNPDNPTQQTVLLHLPTGRYELVLWSGEVLDVEVSSASISRWQHNVLLVPREFP